MVIDTNKKLFKAAICIGLQASGKSTFCRQYFSSNFTYINLDTLHTRNKENQLLEECLQQHHSFVVDNTNPAILDRKRYIQLAKESGYYIEGYFFQSVLSECMERNRHRSGKACIPNKAIAATSNKLELPSYQEGFDKLFFVRIEKEVFIVEPWKETNNLIKE